MKLKSMLFKGTVLIGVITFSMMMGCSVSKTEDNKKVTASSTNENMNKSGNLETGAPKEGVNKITSITSTTDIKDEKGNIEFSLLIRKTNKSLIPTGMGEVESNELWIKYPSGKEELLVECKKSEKLEDTIAGIQNPQVSLDKTKIYFMSAAWMTSGSIHVYDLKTKSERFVCSGNTLEIIGKGQYKGKLLVRKHKYRSAPDYGAYDTYCVVDEDGKELKELGEEVKGEI